MEGALVDDILLAFRLAFSHECRIGQPGGPDKSEGFLPLSLRLTGYSR